jgi:hypothetical protein
MFLMLESCWGQMTWWWEFATSPTFCHHVRASLNENFGKQVSGIGGGVRISRCEMNVEESQSPYLIASQWVWSGLPVVNLPHSNDEWICKWESCSKFKVLNLAPISTPCASGNVGSTHFVYTFWWVQTCFRSAPKSNFLCSTVRISNFIASVHLDKL